MKDLALDENGDLLWKDGDIDWEDSEYSNIVDLLDAVPGEIKQFPYLGPNLRKYKNGPVDIQQAQGDVRLALQSDGWAPQSATAVLDENGKLAISLSVKK